MRRLNKSRHPSDQRALIVDSRLLGPLSWQGAALIANVDTAQPIELAQDVVRRSTADRRMASSRASLACAMIPNDPSRTFLGSAWADWLAAAHIDPEIIWPDVPPAARTLWNAHLYPLAATRDESLALSLPLQDPGTRSGGVAREVGSRAAPVVGRRALRARIANTFWPICIQIEDDVAARHFYAAIQNEQPAAEARKLIGLVHSNIAAPLRSDRYTGWLKPIPSCSCAAIKRWLRPAVNPSGKIAPLRFWRS